MKGRKSLTVELFGIWVVWPKSNAFSALSAGTWNITKGHHSCLQHLPPTTTTLVLHHWFYKQMPSFESILVGGCPGFAQKCMASNNMFLITEDAEPFRTMAASLVAPSSSSRIKHQDLQNFNDVMECFVYIFESFRRANDQPDSTTMTSILQQNTVLSSDLISIIVEHLSKIDKTPAAQSEKKLIHRIGQMVDFKWRLGVAVSSNSCRDLQNPYVVVSFAVVESDGTKNYHSAELTLEQFQVMSKSVSFSRYLV